MEVMKKVITKLPLYIGLTVLIITVIAGAIKIGEGNSIVRPRTKAFQKEVQLEFDFSLPNIIFINFISDTDILGADISLKYISKKIDILPSTLQGMSGYITSGGEINTVKGTFDFSAVTENPVKTGIFALVRVSDLSGKNRIEPEELKIGINMEKTVIYDVQMQPVKISSKGFN